ncbi:glycoside hydrolase family 95 protein [Wukongibacter baidiensis]|uniref:glycoside hydrolase family 95 protein n=1 Tax=Wukongibacter baidiensis TaxID=1723361 RepID=UPI003D7F7C4C
MTRKMRLMISKPAYKWEEALPIGNGSFGGMVFGRCDKEVIGLNEETLWSGKPLDQETYDVQHHLPKVRDLLDKEEYYECNRYINEHMLGHWTQSYMPLGTIFMDFGHKGLVDDYKNELDMERGIVNLSYKHEGVEYKREYFCSEVDDVMIIHLTSSRFAGIRCLLDFDSLLKHEMNAPWEYIYCEGEVPIHADPIYDSSEEPLVYGEDEEGIKFGTVIRVQTDGTVMTNGNTLSIQNGTEATIFIACKTNFIDADTASKDSHRVPIKECEEIIKSAMRKGYETIKEDHVKYFSKLMNRVHVAFGKKKDDMLPTDQRIIKMRESTSEGFDLSLVEELFQFGRYLVVSGSSPKSQATNLQGIWNNLLQAPWCSNYTININTQMNYWLVDVTKLSECMEPLVKLVKDLARKGDVAARGLGCRGWTAHHNTDLWHQTLPVSGNAQYAFWPLGGPWLTTHLYEHYRFTGDQEFLKGVYSIMKGAAEFCLDWCIEEEGKLTTAPSTSPENAFFYKEKNNGDEKRSCVVKGSTMDISIMWELFDQCERAMKELNLSDEDFAKELRAAKEKLFPYQITEDGRIQEWHKDFKERDMGHRHISHLFGLYPGTRINTDEDEKLLKACSKSIETRLEHGGGHTSWSCAWVMLLYARLRDKKMAGEMIEKYQKHSLIRNGLSSHPPFQIDGNYGFTAGIAEMLLQSHNDYIEVLPSLPKELNEGSFEGLCTRGGYEVKAIWKNGKAEKVEVKSERVSSYQIKINGTMYNVDCQKGEWTDIRL